MSLQRGSLLKMSKGANAIPTMRSPAHHRKLRSSEGGRRGTFWDLKNKILEVSRYPRPHGKTKILSTESDCTTLHSQLQTLVSA